MKECGFGEWKGKSGIVQITPSHCLEWHSFAMGQGVFSIFAQPHLVKTEYSLVKSQSAHLKSGASSFYFMIFATFL